MSVENISTREIKAYGWIGNHHYTRRYHGFAIVTQRPCPWIFFDLTLQVTIKINVDKMTNACVSMMTWHIDENLVGTGYPKLSSGVCFHIKI